MLALEDLQKKVVSGRARLGGIPDSAQDPGSYIKQQGEYRAAEIYAKVGRRVREGVGRGLHDEQQLPCERYSEQGKKRPAGDTEHDGSVRRAAQAFVVPGAVQLGDYYRRAAGERYKKAYDNVRQGRDASADGGKSFRADVFADDKRVHSVVELLEYGARRDGQEIQYKLFSYASCCKILKLGFIGFIHNGALYHKRQQGNT